MYIHKWIEWSIPRDLSSLASARNIQTQTPDRYSYVPKPEAERPRPQTKHPHPIVWFITLLTPVSAHVFVLVNDQIREAQEHEAAPDNLNFFRLESLAFLPAHSAIIPTRVHRSYLSLECCTPTSVCLHHTRVCLLQLRKAPSTHTPRVPGKR